MGCLTPALSFAVQGGSPLADFIRAAPGSEALPERVRYTRQQRKYLTSYNKKIMLAAYSQAGGNNMTYEPPVYPTSIPSQTGATPDLPDRLDDIDWLTAARYNELKKELCAVMTELGTLPKGSYADVKSAIAAALSFQTVAFTDYSAISTITGWQTAGRTEKIYYKLVGDVVFFSFVISGTSNSAAASFTLPYTCNINIGSQGACGQCQNNGVDLTTPCLYLLNANTNILNVYKDMLNAGWTASGVKAIAGYGWFIKQ